MEELHESGQLRLASFRLDDVDGVVVRIGVELHEDLPHQPDARSARLVAQRQGVEGAHAPAHEPPVGEPPPVGCRPPVPRQPLPDDRVPVPVQRHRGSGLDLVGPHPQQHRLHHVPQHPRLDDPVNHRQGDLETGVVLQSLHGGRDDGHLRVSGVAQSLAQQGGVVRRPAHTAGLGDGHGRAVGVGPARDELLQQLPDDDDRRVAGIVVHVLEARLHGLPARVLQEPHVEPCLAQDGDQHPEVDGRHLRSKDLESFLTHLLRERRARVDVPGGDARDFLGGGTLGGVRQRFGLGVRGSVGARVGEQGV